MTAWTVEQRRGGICEASQRVHACAVDADGALLWQVGTDLTTTFRSAAKPFQLELSLSLLDPALVTSLLPGELALGSASHHGEPAHVAELGRLLAKLKRERSHLYCGAHEPSNPEAARALWARGEAPDVLHNNCAGKHAFMAAACLAQGYREDYRPQDHPLQRAISASLAGRTGAAPGSVIDGCGVPCFVLPLSHMARAYAQLARAASDGGADLLARIAGALLAQPFLMSGSRAYDGWLIGQFGVVAKIGAQGLLCVAIPQLGVGVAIKLESGVDPARPVAAHALLQHYFPHVFGAALPAEYWELRNVVGDRVGELVCVP